jgi:4,5-dihydroxyphthalate decarboxylase
MSVLMLELSSAFSSNARTRPLLDGLVHPQGIRLIASALGPGEMFWRQLKFAEFDVSEMSLSSLMIATSRGPTPWVALPIFTTRYFFHTGILVRVASNIAAPQDLRGKRVGILEYQQTSLVWIRGALQHEFGVTPGEMEWHMERGPDHSHGGATGFKVPDGVRLSYIPPQTDVGKMLIAGELDAALFYPPTNNLVDRGKIDLSRRPEARLLFADPLVENRRYFAKTGLYPINHCVVVRRSLAERSPWIALNLFSAFSDAKAESLAACDEALAPYREAGVADGALARGPDPMAYGVRSNHTVLETLARYLCEQGLTRRVVRLDEVFAKSTLDL